MPAGEFRNKAVVIAVVARGTTDALLRTPLDSEMSGAEVQANALAPCCADSPCATCHSLVDILVIALLASLPAAVIAGSAVALLAAAQLAFQGGWILAVVVPLAALAAATLLVGALGAAGVVRRRQPSGPATSLKHYLTT